MSDLNELAAGAREAGRAKMLRRSEDHRYFFQVSPNQERELLSVTRTLADNNIIDDTHFSDRVRTRGKLTDTIVECMLQDKPLPEWFQPYIGFVLSMRAFLDRNRIEVKSTKEMLCNVSRGCAGELDFTAIYLNELCVVDIKLSEPTPWHGVQLAAYTWMKFDATWFKVPRYGLYLRGDGSIAKPKRYSEHEDLDVFLRALDNLHWRVRHGSYDRAYGRSIDYRRDAESGGALRIGFNGIEAFEGVDRDERANQGARHEDPVEWFDRRHYKGDDAG